MQFILACVDVQVVKWLEHMPHNAADPGSDLCCMPHPLSLPFQKSIHCLNKGVYAKKNI